MHVCTVCMYYVCMTLKCMYVITSIYLPPIDLGWRNVAWESEFQRPEGVVPGQRLHTDIVFIEQRQKNTVPGEAGE